MLKNFCVFLPDHATGLEEEWEQCLVKIVKTCNTGYKPVKLNIFVNQPDYSSYIRIKKQIGKSVIDTFGVHSPAFNVTLHPPERNLMVGVEGVFIPDNQQVVSRFWHSTPYVVINTGSYKEVWGAGLGNDLFHNDTAKASVSAFDHVREILSQEDLTFDHIVRQWNYIGEILKMKGGFQNYQVFNEIRSEYYKKFRTVHGYPAATGIGMKYGGVFLDFIAVKADENFKIKPVNNPNQINAYEYGQQVLIGLTSRGKPVKNPPQFERALLMVNKTHKYMFISGTASIIGQETIGKGDVREQTLVTIENINKLTSGEHVSQLLDTPELLHGKYTLVRVYVKNQEDFKEVRKICSEHFPGVPAIYIEGDICREDLLTEIEAEYLL